MRCPVLTYMPLSCPVLTEEMSGTVAIHYEMSGTNAAYGTTRQRRMTTRTSCRTLTWTLSLDRSLRAYMRTLANPAADLVLSRYLS